jgi:hypothetical protein
MLLWSGELWLRLLSGLIGSMAILASLPLIVRTTHVRLKLWSCQRCPWLSH